MCKPLCNKSCRIWLLLSPFHFVSLFYIFFFCCCCCDLACWCVCSTNTTNSLVYTHTHTHRSTWECAQFCRHAHCMRSLEMPLSTTTTTESATKSSDKCIPPALKNKIYDVLPEQTKAKCHHRACHCRWNVTKRYGTKLKQAQEKKKNKEKSNKSESHEENAANK